MFSEVNWFTSHLTDDKFGTVAGFVPNVFESYGRLLHPAYESGELDHPVRWAEVSQWSGRKLERLSAFHSVAFPIGDPSTYRPWEIPPQQGSIDEHDLEELIAVLRTHTSTPDDCWVGVWNGFGNVWPLESHPVVHAPHRDYFLTRGSIETALHLDQFYDRAPDGPNIFWPNDHAWFVATDIDLAWTYVGSSKALIAALKGSPTIELLDAKPDDWCSQIEPWVEAAAEQAADELIATGSTTIETYFGDIRFSISGSGTAHQPLGLSEKRAGGSGWTHLGDGPIENHREHIQHILARGFTALVED
jgi:hypothetical protein